MRRRGTGGRLRRASALVRCQLRTSVMLALQYRWEALFDVGLTVFWTALTIVPLWLVFEARPVIAGHHYPEVLAVLGFFTMLQAVLDGVIAPSLGGVVEQVRTGSFDYVLLKPVDAQLLVSTGRFAPFRLVHLLTGLAVVARAVALSGHTPTVLEVLRATICFACSVTMLYSLWLVMISAVFHVGRLDNLRFLFGAVFDAARWPASVYRGALLFVFTFVIPLGPMTSYPAEALFGSLAPMGLLESVLGALCSVMLARTIFSHALARYASASS